jgi:poly(hydroxyalkanoate) depolymerase family esterase
LARRLRVALVLPEQTFANNRGRCFNWYRATDVRRGSGEAKSIRQMVRVATERFRSDRRRVFMAGLSAGGAIAAALLAAYPAVFAAGAVFVPTVRLARFAGSHGDGQMVEYLARHRPEPALRGG